MALKRAVLFWKETNTKTEAYFFLGGLLFRLGCFRLRRLGCLGLLGALGWFLGSCKLLHLFGALCCRLCSDGGRFLHLLGDFLTAGFLAAGFFAFARVFLAGFFLVSAYFLLSLKEPEAPVPLVTKLLMVSLTRELFFSTL